MTAVYGNSGSGGGGYHPPPPTTTSAMDVKNELLYRDDELLLVKSEPSQQLAFSALTQGLATSSAGSASNGLFASFGATVMSVQPPPNKRARTIGEDFLGSPSPGAISIGAPLTPSPGPPSQQQFGLSNGYSSPMSSGSYDPYSPNGKIGEYMIVYNWIPQ